MQEFEIQNHPELIKFSKDAIDIDFTESNLNQIERAKEILEVFRESDIPSDLVADTLAGDQLLVLGAALHNLNLLKEKAKQKEPDNLELNYDINVATLHVEFQRRWILNVGSKEIGFTSDQLFTHYVDYNALDEIPGWYDSFVA